MSLFKSNWNLANYYIFLGMFNIISARILYPSVERFFDISKNKSLLIRKNPDIGSDSFFDENTLKTLIIILLPISRNI